MKKVYVYGKKVPLGKLKLVSKILLQFSEKWELSVFEPLSILLEKNQIKVPAHSVFNSTLDVENDGFLVTFGGDGTFLDAASLVASTNIPILGINMGRMGFLASVAEEEINESIKMLVAGEFVLEQRSMLKVELDSKAFGDYTIALNEITLHKRDTSSMIKIHAYLNDEFLNSYWADGLIAATPTGSTAYSLSCGGPIILPDSKNFVITPVAPHSLNVRPMVIPDDKIMTFKVEGRTRFFMISIDSRSAIIDSSINIKAYKNPYPLNLIRLPLRDFSGTIRKKLSWGLDIRN